MPTDFVISVYLLNFQVKFSHNMKETKHLNCHFLALKRKSRVSNYLKRKITQTFSFEEKAFSAATKASSNDLLLERVSLSLKKVFPVIEI